MLTTQRLTLLALVSATGPLTATNIATIRSSQDGAPAPLPRSVCKTLDSLRELGLAVFVERSKVRYWVPTEKGRTVAARLGSEVAA